MKTIVHIIGNRPQFIKLAVLYPELKKIFNQKIIHTGQHFDHSMSDIFFDQLNIPSPDINLNIQNSSSEKFIEKVSEKLKEYFRENQDSVAFVYGDTNTTLAGATAAKQSNIRLIHFEAGVRTGAKDMPEEINRLATDKLADVNYCCTNVNFQNMIREGFGGRISSVVINTGDLMLDAFLKTSFAEKNITSSKNYVACTIHRAENLYNRRNLENIINALNKINKSFPVIFPIHPNTKNKIREYGINASFQLINPVGYFEMKTLLKECDFIITDSGGVGREAYFLQKRSLIIMEKPFWPEIIKDSCSLNTGAEKNSIVTAFSNLQYLKPDFNRHIFGDGNASVKIAEHLSQYLYNS